MLNEIETNIFETFSNIYEMKITNNIDTQNPNMNIIFDEEHIPINLINKFFKKSENYIQIILENALINAIQTNDTYLLNKFIELEKNINNIDSLDNDTKRLIVYNCIKNLIEKKNFNLNEIEINKIKNLNVELFLNINGYKHIKSINTIYRETIINLADYLKVELNYTLLEFVLFTNKYDNELKIINEYLKTERDIKLFKLYLIRIILCDVFIYEVYATYNIKKTNPELFENADIITTPFMNHISDCINKNLYKLPKDDFEREQTLNKYLYSNSYPDKKALEFVEQYYENELKKIYPLYILDKIK